MKPTRIFLLLPFTLLLASCSADTQNALSDQPDYDQTKKMVVDILKTDDGKKAIQDVITSDAMKEKLVMDQQVVSDTIKQTLTSDQATEIWAKTFSDKDFAQTAAKNMKSENQQLLKDLMNDPEYRAMMVEVFKEPEIQKQMTDALKSQEYRQHLQQVITETVESPLFRTKLEEILKESADKAAKEQAGG